MKQLLLYPLLLSFAALCYGQQPTRLQINLSKTGAPMEINRYGLGIGGFTDENPWQTRLDEIRVLHPRLIRLFVQEYYDLMPAKGHYNFEKLDRSVDLLRKTGAEPLLCIVFKPKLLFPKVDNRLVEPTTWREWQDLIEAVVNHYKNRGTRVPYWEVGNEPVHGGGTPWSFNPENYYRFYRHTVEAIRKADPLAKVGGPALAGGFDREAAKAIGLELLARCAKEGTPIDFFSWHGYNNDATWYGRTTEQAHEMIAKHPNLKLETVIDEWNVSLRDMVQDPQFQPAYLIEATYGMKNAGLSYSNYYHIRDTFFFPKLFLPFFPKDETYRQLFFWNYRPQPLGLFDLQDRVRPAYFAFKLLSRLTGDRIALKSEQDAVHGLASYDAEIDAYNILVWNYSDHAVQVEIAVDGAPKKLAGTHQMLDARGPSDDDIHRIRLLDYVSVEPGKGGLRADLDAYGVHYWMVR